MKNVTGVWFIILLLCISHSLFGFDADNSLVLHLDASSLSEQYSNGDNVSLWPDLSGHNNPASQPEAVNQPQFIASDAKYNNNSIVRFDGANDWMALPSSAFNASSFTIFVVGRFGNIDGAQYMVASHNGTGSGRVRIAIEGDKRFVWRGGTSGVLASDANNKVHIFALNSEAQGYLDGKPIGDWSNSSRDFPAALNIGSYNRGQKDFLKGEIAEVIAFDKVLTVEQLNEIGAYLESKYNLNSIYTQNDKRIKDISPSDEAQNIPLDKVLSWEKPLAVDSPLYNVYFGTDKKSLTMVSHQQKDTSFDPFDKVALASGTKYYWRVDVEGVNEPGHINSFRTRPAKKENIAGFGLDSYVISGKKGNAFEVVSGDKICSIYVDSNDFEVCHIAADLLAKDIESVCGIKPKLYNDLTSAKGNVIIVGTLGHSKVVDALARKSKINTNGVVDSWETFALETVTRPVGKIDNALVIFGSDRRGTAYGVFDLSEQIGVSPWNWWGDVPVEYKKNIYVRSGRYKQGPPSVKYRGIFINDEDWALTPWARNNYSQQDGFIGPEVYKKTFELLLRLKANYIWPGMHLCTKAFHSFEENRQIADDYAIVMGSSHCEQMSRNNLWEWYRWMPSDGSERGDWDWCKNSAGILEYWRDGVAANGQYENIYTTGMRGIHDSLMPCEGLSDPQKALAMQNELFPAQRKIFAELVNPDVTKVPQIFCPYKEVLGLYNLGMEVPDDITLVWPDDNYGYIRRLSNTIERQRSGSSGVYYHFSYLGPPMSYLWIYSTPPALIWEEMVKAYEYGADRLWVFNVGDIKPAEIGIDYSLRLAWDIDNYTNDNVREYLQKWASQQFGYAVSEEVADILVEYFRLAQTRKPEHLLSGGFSFTMNDFGDEIERRLAQFAQITDRANAVYQKLPQSYRDAFYQLVLYQVRCADLMNQKILYARKNASYASQGRVSAAEYALRSKIAFEQILAETNYYNNVMADGKWKGMMNWRPLNSKVFQMLALNKVSPVNGADMAVVLEGQSREVSDSKLNSQAYSDNFASGSAKSWAPLNTGRWQITDFNGSKEYAINTSGYENLSGDRLGEMALLNDYEYDYFNFKCNIRSCDNLNRNNSADCAMVFGYQNEMNYYYLIMCNDGKNSAVHRVLNGNRSQIGSLDIAIPDNNYHLLEVAVNANGLQVKYDGKVASEVISRFPAGKLAVGSYNDAAAFTNVEISPVAGAVSPQMLPEFDVYTKNRHFIDIFNKGDKSFKWSAKASDSWITLSDNSGNVSTQQRIWTGIDWSKLPYGKNNGTIIISGTQGNVEVIVNAFNPASPRPEDLNCFVESCGYVSMEAENYSRKVDKNGAVWSEISTLGSTGDTITVLPFTTQSCSDISTILADSPSIEYDFYAWSTGNKSVAVRAIPTHAINSDMGLRYAIAIDDQQPVIVEYDTLEWSSQWNLNVLQGVAVSKSTHNIDSTGIHTLKVWMVDPGVVLDKIIIGNTSASHLGPVETAVVK